VEQGGKVNLTIDEIVQAGQVRIAEDPEVDVVEFAKTPLGQMVLVIAATAGIESARLLAMAWICIKVGAEAGHARAFREMMGGEN
jgi:hypothetical protein